MIRRLYILLDETSLLLSVATTALASTHLYVSDPNDAFAPPSLLNPSAALKFPLSLLPRSMLVDDQPLSKHTISSSTLYGLTSSNLDRMIAPHIFSASTQTTSFGRPPSSSTFIASSSPSSMSEFGRTSSDKKQPHFSLKLQLFCPLFRNLTVDMLRTLLPLCSQRRLGQDANGVNTRSSALTRRTNGSAYVDVPMMTGILTSFLMHEVNTADLVMFRDSMTAKLQNIAIVVTRLFGPDNFFTEPTTRVNTKTNGSKNDNGRPQKYIVTDAIGTFLPYLRSVASLGRKGVLIPFFIRFFDTATALIDFIRYVQTSYIFTTLCLFCPPYPIARAPYRSHVSAASFWIVSLHFLCIFLFQTPNTDEFQRVPV